MNNHNRSFHHSNESQTQKISSSIYVTNFPDSTSSRDLWKVCSDYGTGRDVFIPFKKSKAGKKFAFGRLVTVLILNSAVPSSSFASVLKERYDPAMNSKPVLVLDESCLKAHEFNLSLMGLPIKAWTPNSFKKMALLGDWVELDDPDPESTTLLSCLKFTLEEDTDETTKNKNIGYFIQDDEPKAEFKNRRISAVSKRRNTNRRLSSMLSIVEQRLTGTSSAMLQSLIKIGSPSSEFPFFCGLKQGDPLAPYLFILIMESLHISFSRAVSDGFFKGIDIQGSTSISHLFYADDAIFIGEWSEANLVTRYGISAQRNVSI
ncbi:RNA-directed DNA polymerase, eukaryota [Tanacetum coccineum]